MRGIYGIRYDDTYVYVGQSTDIKRRWKDHYKKYSVSEYDYEVLELTEDLDDREHYYIRKHKPTDNILHNPYKRHNPISPNTEVADRDIFRTPYLVPQVIRDELPIYTGDSVKAEYYGPFISLRKMNTKG